MSRSKAVRRLAIDLFLGLIGLGFLGAGAVFVYVASLEIPNLDSFEARRVSQSTKIYDRTGEVLLYDIHDDVRRTVVPFEDISRHVKNASVAIEDAEFYVHKGIRPLSFLRAVLANLQTGSFSQGGSTITQQVVKNALLTTDKRVSRKLKEWILAVKLERVMSKDEILAHYLNESPYGGNIYGVEEASRAFFGKRASEVSLTEAAYMAALPQAPTFYSPYGNNRDRLEERKGLVLQKMLENGFITAEEYASSTAETVEFKPLEAYGIKAPHFVLFVKEQLEAMYGKGVVEDGGLSVVTTLDYALQEQAEEMAARHALENEKNFNAENVAMIALDPKTGDILSMVGSRDYFDTEIDGNFNVALGKRQPGSSFKPFAYATALKRGYTPETTVFDVRTEFSTSCAPDGTPLTAGREDLCYMPENYDHVYRGPISLKNALAQSINIPAIKVLYLAGMKESLETARDLGITTLSDIDRYGLTLVLGGGEVSLLEMTSAYGVFSAEGARNPYRSILSVKDSSGEDLFSASLSPRQVLERDIALKITDMLSDNDARAPAFGERSFLYIPERDVAVKTGTTNDYRDAWIIGYSPNIVVGAWAGNNDNSSMEKKVAGFIIAPLWNEFITAALGTLPNERFSLPSASDDPSLKPVLRGIWEGNETYVVDKVTGKLATDNTPVDLREERFVREIHSILHWVDKRNPRGPAPQNPENDPQYVLWEEPVRAWAASRNLFDAATSSTPSETDDVHLPAYAPVPVIHGVDAARSYEQNERITVTTTSSGRFPLSKVEYFVNGKLLGSTNQAPFMISFTPRYLSGVGKDNRLQAIVYDSVQNRAEVATTFKVSLPD